MDACIYHVQQLLISCLGTIYKCIFHPYFLLFSSKVEELVQEDSRLDRYPKLVKGESKVVWEWQGMKQCVLLFYVNRMLPSSLISCLFVIIIIMYNTCSVLQMRAYLRKQKLLPVLYWTVFTGNLLIVGTKCSTKKVKTRSS